MAKAAGVKKRHTGTEQARATSKPYSQSPSTAHTPGKKLPVTQGETLGAAGIRTSPAHLHCVLRRLLTTDPKTNPNQAMTLSPGLAPGLGKSGVSMAQLTQTMHSTHRSMCPDCLRDGSSLSFTVWSDKVTAAQKTSYDRQPSCWHEGALCPSLFNSSLLRKAVCKL